MYVLCKDHCPESKGMIGHPHQAFDSVHSTIRVIGSSQLSMTSKLWQLRPSDLIFELAVTLRAA
jgi:hypothetical protein